MKEYFIVTNSFAAPFFSDQDTQFVKADGAVEALEKAVKKYNHPAGLFAADCFSSSDAYHKNQKPIARWLCNHEIAKQKAMKGKGSYSYLGNGPGSFEVDGRRYTVKNPKDGRLVLPEEEKR